MEDTNQYTTSSPKIEAENPRATYEIHITIGPNDPSAEIVERFKTVCALLKIKPIDVGVLRADGFHRFLQSSKYVVGDLAHAHETRQFYASAFRVLGFQVMREKIEGIAVSFDALPPELYYENHIVLAVSTDYYSDEKGFQRTHDIETLEKLNKGICADLPVHVPLSFNMKHHDRRECFVTARNYGTTREVNDQNVDRHVEMLTSAGFPLIKVIREAVIYDSNNLIDSELK